MFGMGTQEILIVLVVVGLLFGAKRLPELARGLGEGIREFKSTVSSVTSNDDKKG